MGQLRLFAARLLPDPATQASFDKLVSGPDEFNGFAGQIGLDLNQLRTARVTRAAGARPTEVTMASAPI